MPNPTFFNLPEAKRQRLMDAVWQEFTTASYMDASINKIIQTAGISRGSFYQYFSGKQDVFCYILQILMETGGAMFQAQLTAHSNDLFAAIQGMYDLLLWKQSKTRRDPSADRIYALFRLNTDLDMNQFAELLDCKKLAQAMSSLLEQSGYTTENPLALFRMFIAISVSNAVDTLRCPAHETQNRQLLEAQLNMIRRGLTPCDKERTTEPC